MIRSFYIFTLFMLISTTHAALLDPIAKLVCKKNTRLTTLTISKDATSQLMEFGNKRCSFKIDSVEDFKRGADEQKTVYISITSCDNKKVTENGFDSFGHLKKGFIVFTFNGNSVSPTAHIFENSQAVSCHGVRLKSENIRNFRSKNAP